MLQSIQKNVSWRAIPVAGFAAGTLFLLVNVFLSPVVLDVDPALILRYFGSLALGSGVLLEGGSAAVIAGILVNYAVSMIAALVIAIVVHRWGLMVGIVLGALMGLAIYGINLYTMTLFFEWFFAINSSVLVLSHILFGAAAGGIYERFDHYDVAFDL